MTRIHARLALGGAALAAAILTLATPATAQVRRSIGNPPPGPSEPQARPAEPAAPAAPAPGPQGEEPEDDQDRPQRPVDPEMIARIVEMRGPMWLIEQEAVRKELQISDAQFEKLKEVDNKVQETRRESMEQFREQMQQQGGRGGPGGAPGGGGPGGRGPGGFQGGPGGFGGFGGGPGGFQGGPGGPGGFPGGDAFRTMMQQMQQQADMAVASVLSKDQVKRLKQIILQAKGPMAVTEPELQAALNLMPFQVEQIAMIKQEMETKQQVTNNARRELFGAMFGRGRNQGDQPGQGGNPQGGNPQGGNAQPQQSGGQDDEDNNNRGRGRFQMDPETQAKMEQLQTQADVYEKEAIQKIGKVLTRPQISQYNKMIGDKFDFAQIDMSTAGRGFGGPGGFGGRGGRGGRGG